MLKRVIIAFFAVLLFSTNVLAMTAEEFLSHKAENIEIAKYVLNNAEAGGLPFLILQAQEILEISKNSTDPVKSDHARRTAFMHCAFASHLVKSGSKTERDKYEKSLISTLGQVMAAMGMNKQDELIKSLQGASAIYNEILYPEKKNDAQPQSSPALSEKYLGDYTYQNDTCGGKLIFSKTGAGYTMEVETSCESGGTCGGLFDVVYSKEHNGIVTMKDVESGISFAVGPKGISVDNVPVHFCGRGAYMEGEYVHGRKASVAQNNSMTASKFDDLAITYITWRGGVYPFEITVGQFVKWLKLKEISCTWEDINNNNSLLHLSVYDKVQKIDESYRILFQTQDGAQRAIVTRLFKYDLELVGPDRDRVFLPLFQSANLERDKIPDSGPMKDMDPAVSRKKGEKICGKVNMIEELPTPIKRFSVEDANGKNLGRYYYILYDDSCAKLVKRNTNICFVVNRTEKNSNSMASVGVTEPVLHWINSCQPQR